MRRWRRNWENKEKEEEDDYSTVFDIWEEKGIFMQHENLQNGGLKEKTEMEHRRKNKEKDVSAYRKRGLIRRRKEKEPGKRRERVTVE